MQAIKNIFSNDNISLDLVCFLPYENDSKRLVYCAELPIISSEFFTAGQSGIKPEHLLVIDMEEYDGETKVYYEDMWFSVYRTFPRKDGLIELYLRVKTGIQHGSD